MLDANQGLSRTWRVPVLRSSYWIKVRCVTNKFTLLELIFSSCNVQAGPGFAFVTSQEGVNWRDIASFYNDDTLYSVEDRNRALVDSEVADIYSVKEQEAILRMDNCWNEFAKETDTPLEPVAHKSPSSIPFQRGKGGSY
jgi:hypothetical protein